MEEILEGELSEICYLLKQLLEIKVEKILITEDIKKSYKLKQSSYFEFIDELNSIEITKKAFLIDDILPNDIIVDKSIFVRFDIKHIYLVLSFETNLLTPNKLKSFKILSKRILKVIQSKSKQVEVIENLIGKQLDSLFLNNPLALSLVELKTRKYIKINDLFVSQSGYEESEIIGKTAKEIGIFKHPEELAYFYHLVATQQKISHLSMQFNTKFGKVIDCIISAEIVNYQKTEYLLSYIIDISEQKKIEKILIETNQLAKIIAWDYDSETDKIYLPEYASKIFENEIQKSKNIGAFLNLFVEGEYRTRISKAFLAGLENGENFSLETKIKLKDNQEKWVIVSGSFEQLKNQKYQCLGMILDIDEQKKVTDIANIGHWNYDIENKEIKWSDNTLKLFEAPSEFKPNINHFFNYYAAGESRNSAQKNILEAISNGTPYDHEVEIITHTGKTKWIREIARVEKSNEKIKTIYGIIQDIDNFKQIQKKLVASTAMANVGSWEIDFQKEIIIWDDISKKIHEVSPDYIPSFENRLDTFADEFKEDVVKEINNLINTGLGKTITLKVKTGTGKEKWIRTKSDIDYFEGKPRRIYGIMQDVDTLKRTEIELQKTLDMALSQNDRLKRFSYIVSHNIRSDVSNIQYISDFLLEDQNSEAKKEYLGYLNTTVTKLNDTIFDLNQVLEIQDKTQLHLTFVDLSKLIEEVLLKYSTEIKEAECKININLDSFNKIFTYEPYISSIIDSIINNALKFRNPAKQSSIEILTFVKNGKKSISIIDNGIGIDTVKYKNQLFGLYKTFHTKIKQTKGFSLYLAKAKMEALNGNIKLESTLDKSTSINITF